MQRDGEEADHKTLCCAHLHLVSHLVLCCARFTTYLMPQFSPSRLLWKFDDAYNDVIPRIYSGITDRQPRKASTSSLIFFSLTNIKFHDCENEYAASGAVFRSPQSRTATRAFPFPTFSAQVPSPYNNTNFNLSKHESHDSRRLPASCQRIIENITRSLLLV
jgi:hypothetical protein